MTAVSISSLRHSAALGGAGPASVVVTLDVNDDIVFDPDVVLDLFYCSAAVPTHSYRLRDQRSDISWLPRGQFEVFWTTPEAAFPAEPCRMVVSVHCRVRGETVLADRSEVVIVGSAASTTKMIAHWHIQSVGDTPAIESLAWSHGHKNWFYRHFDHAAKVIISYMFADSPLLRGRILDVGCGDGITDLGIALRQQPQLLIGVDPFRGFDRLPGVLGSHALGHLKLPECLRFEAADANFLPYADDSFDVVISWGSLEHIAGGYLQALREIKRVLRPDGLFFVTPGLYYSNFGHHLGEYCTEPFFHLTKSLEELHELVLGNEPKYMDRAGEFASSAQYWQWFNELNRITVPQFERELRALEFDFWRVALRTEDLIEYTPKLQGYSMQDLATVEVYLSCVNRKKQRGT